MESCARLLDWHRDGQGRLVGIVRGHPRLDDGRRIRTSFVVRQYRVGARLMARTRNTLYELAGPDGREWFAAGRGQGEVPPRAPARRFPGSGGERP
jgi:hypothetical protein